MNFQQNIICPYEPIHEKMPLFNQAFISGREDLPYFLLATEWGISSGLCENWDSKIKLVKTLEVTELL